MFPTLDVDLTLDPSSRWKIARAQIEWARSLVETILDEIGGVDPYRELVELYAAEHVTFAVAAELKSLADQCCLSYTEVLTANLYYDFVKLLLGCTAFAVDTPDGPLHARNMDWFSANNCLSEYTSIINFHGQYQFQSISWPGYVGVLSGIAPGRFTVTLNAALSCEPQVPGQSIALLLRDVFETCATYEDAIDKMSSTTITSDCLLLITGPNEGQISVIERTPTKSAIRRPESGYIVVTNDFRALPQTGPDIDSPLYATACGRYDSAYRCLLKQLPSGPQECFDVLNNPGVKMSITVQQMVMSPRSGALHVRTQHTG